MAAREIRKSRKTVRSQRLFWGRNIATLPSLIRLCYVSEANLPVDVDPADEIRRILDRSRWWNASVGITGSLFFNRTLFSQILEGPGGEVEKLFAQISADPRHRRVIRIDWREIGARMFPNWSMAFVGTGTDSDRYADLALSEASAAELAQDGMLDLMVKIVRNREAGLGEAQHRAEQVVEALGEGGR